MIKQNKQHQKSTNCVNGDKNLHEEKEDGTDDYREWAILNRWSLRKGLIQCSGRLVGVSSRGTGGSAAQGAGVGRGTVGWVEVKDLEVQQDW